MIKRIGDQFVLLSKDAKKVIGKFPTKLQAEEREKDIIKIKRTKALEKFKSDRVKRNIV